MRRSRMSIVGLYNYDNSIFDNLHVPDGVNKQRAVDCIILECSELELIYPNHDFMKDIIDSWSESIVNNWDKLNKALNIEYDPAGKVESFRRDRTESIEEDGSGHSEGNSDHNVAGFNATTMAKATNDETELDSETHNNRDNTIVDEYTRKYYGDIGIHSTQELLEAEIKLRQEYNIYKIIAKDFKSEFCLLIY